MQLESSRFTTVSARFWRTNGTIRGVSNMNDKSLGEDTTDSQICMTYLSFLGLFFSGNGIRFLLWDIGKFLKTFNLMVNYVVDLNYYFCFSLEKTSLAGTQKLRMMSLKSAINMEALFTYM